MKIKDNENVKINNHNNKKENVKIIIIIIMKLIRTMIGIIKRMILKIKMKILI